MVDDVTMNNMFQDFTGDRCQTDRVVVFSFGTVFISTFEQGSEALNSIEQGRQPPGWHIL